MMFSYRLVRLIESHADALAAGLEEKVQATCLIAHFRACHPYPACPLLYGVR